MDKFDKILRDKLQNHDAGMANGAWEQFAQNFTQFDAFENAVKNKAEQHNAGNGNAAWEQMAQRLDQLQPASNWKYYLTGGIAAAFLGFGIYYFSGDDSVKENKTVDKIENSKTIIASNLGKDGLNKSPKVTNTPVDGSPLVVDVKLNDKKDEVKIDNKVDNKIVSNDIKDVKKDNTLKEKEIVKVDKAEAKTITVTETFIPKPEFSVEASEVCQNGDLTFTALNNKADYKLIWLVNGEEVSTSTNAKLVFHKLGVQQIQLVYAQNVNDKTVMVISDKTSVNVLALPTSNFEIEKSNLESIPEYTTKPEKVQGATYMWNFGDGKFSTEEEVAHVFHKKGTYPVSLTVTGSNGCKAKSSSRVEVSADYNLLAPNSFTPNNDGTNETFIPMALTVMTDVKFKMSIFDRSGTKLYETSRIDAPWDGMNAKTGQKCRNNAYIWRVEINLPNGGKEIYTGSVTLLD